MLSTDQYPGFSVRYISVDQNGNCSPDQHAFPFTSHPGSFTTSSKMNFIFKSKQKTPPELVRNLREAIARLDGSGLSTEGKRKVGAACRIWLKVFTHFLPWSGR